MKYVKPKVTLTSTTVGISSSNYLELCAAEQDLKRQLIDQAAIQLINSLRKSLKHETSQSIYTNI